MNYEQEQQFAAEVKRYVTEQLPLSQISDSELQQQIEDIVEQRIGAGYQEHYCAPHHQDHLCSHAADHHGDLRQAWQGGVSSGEGEL